MNTNVKTILVTGATGFLGRALAKRLVSLGHNVIGLGRNKTKGNELQTLGINFIDCDLEDKQKLESIMRNVDFVVHCAAKSSPWGRYKDFYKSNVNGTKNIIDICLKNNVTRLVYISSPSVYFKLKDEFNITETANYTNKPVNNYIKTKIIAEKLIDDAFNKGLDVITLRPRAIFGIGDTAIFPRLIKTNNKRFLPITTNKDILVDLTYIENVVDAILLAVNADKKYSGEKYNITNDEHIYLHKTIEKIITSLNYEYKTKKIPYKLLKLISTLIDNLYYIFLPNKEPTITQYSLGVLSFSQTFDISKAKNELGYIPKISTNEGLKCVIDYYKEHKCC